MSIVVLLIMSLVASFVQNRGNAADASAVIRWGYYVTYDGNSNVSLKEHIGQLDIVSPYFYHLTPSGTIKAFDEPATTRLLKDNGVKVLPLIQNESRWNDFRTTIETPEKRAAIVDRLYELVQTKAYDGVHIDFEGVNAADRDLLTDLMTRLYAAFHPQGWLVSQAVIARTSDTSTYWGGAYDYPKLSQVNDYITIMAYDYGYASRIDPIAVAPLWWVEDVVSYAVTRIPREKLLLGIPLYGYDWNTTSGPPAKSVTHAVAMQLATRSGATAGYSMEHQAPWVKYTDDNGHSHETWFENGASFEAKLRLVTDHRVAGFATWRLGHEDPAVWTVIAGLSTPATRLPPLQDSANRVYFQETGHSLAYGFLKYWNANGGLARFGYPRTEEFTEFDPLVGQSYTVQYFERARFEYHPEFRDTQFEILLGHVGRWALQQRGGDPQGTPPVAPKTGARYFPETGHNVSGPFLTYWEGQGGLYSFGFPL
ncbi:MAG TPA: glycosyl hydrolase family 18 protein, partial [Thermomicrobiales bacterium]|nr:glycosyl hydrolase family 18 protein [Thermomicrobiales bacterium]